MTDSKDQKSPADYQKPVGAPKYTTKADGEMLRATKRGFYNGEQIDVGETFRALSKGETFGWARAAKPVDAAEEHDVAPAFLERSIKEILPDLRDKTDKELNELISAEQGGQMRKGLLSAIQDELDNRVGKDAPVPGPAHDADPFA
jgi:hypothetical protein